MNNVDLSEFIVAERSEERASHLLSNSNDQGVSSQAAEAPQSGLEYIQDEERPLFNGGAPAVVLQREKASHRVIGFLKAQGLSNVEVAERVGVSSVAVAYISKQPHVAAMIVEEIAKAGRSEVEVVLQSAALDSVNKLIEIRDSEGASADVQRKAANDLLDRVFGRPNQPISHSNIDLDTLSDAELAKIAKSGKTN